ncbi:MAG: membrane integrity-associated transporter subunit PqiC [Comamonas sp.]|nr:membrane integrity-associated transporter subunit PqiC [Comamonas sp.]
MTPHFSRLRRIAIALALGLGLAACQSLPTPPQEPMRFDLGAAPSASSSARTNRDSPPAPLVLADIQAPWQAEGSTTTMHYRLPYDLQHPQALHAYSLASWSQPPEILVQERLRHWLSEGGRMVLSGEGGRIAPYINGQRPPSVQLALEEFLQVFEHPSASYAIVRLRATVVQDKALGQELLGQQLLEARISAPSLDAAGGAQALAQAVDTIGQQLTDWLNTLPRTERSN